MATKPALLPQWNSGGANNVEPSAGKKVLGWILNEIPPSSTLNWLGKLIYEWLAYVDAPVGSAGVTGGDAFAAVGGAGSGGTGGAGLKGTGGATNGIGVRGLGTGTGAGVEGSGAGTPMATAATTGSGVVGRGGQTNGHGGEFFAKGQGAGVKATGGDNNGGSYGGAGINASGGSAGGVGGVFTGTTGFNGIEATGGSTAGLGGLFTGGATGDGVRGGAGATSGHGVVALRNNNATAPFRIATGTQPTGTNVVGAMYVDASGILYICTVAGTPGTWTKVGTQT